MATIKRTYSDAATNGEEMVTVPKHAPKQCTECGAKSTPQWRQGPQGPQTLCNACGVRYSRLHRKAKAPKNKSTGDAPSALKDEGAAARLEDDEQQDSEGLTTFHAHAHNNAQPSPRATAAVRSPPTMGSPSVTRTSRSVRTELPFLQPCSPSSAITNTPNSHKLPPGRTSLTPLSRIGARAPEARAFGPQSAASEFDVECEAANMLLSLHASGSQAGSQPAQHAARAASKELSQGPVAGAARPQAPLGALKQEAPVVPLCGPLPAAIPASFEMLVVSQGGSAAGPQSTELRALQQLCSIFDERFKELVAAQVACSAVEQVLRVKQEEARIAQLAARSAAQLLMQHATQLVNHDAVQRALAVHAAKLEAVQETAEGRAALAALTGENPVVSNEASGGSQGSNDHRV